MVMRGGYEERICPVCPVALIVEVQGSAGSGAQMGKRHK